MNSRTQLLELSVESRQLEEAIACLLNSVMMFRIVGKFETNSDGSYSVGSVGYQDVDCDFIDITYLSCSSVFLQEILNKEISSFSHKLRNDRKGSGHITLEFFQRKKSHWSLLPFTENIPWEVWTLRVELLRHYTEDLRETVGLSLSDKILEIVEIVGRDEYLPAVPASHELSSVFNTDILDVQPYLFNVSFVTADHSPTFGDAFKKLMKTTVFS